MKKLLILLTSILINGCAVFGDKAVTTAKVAGATYSPLKVYPNVQSETNLTDVSIASYHLISQKATDDDLTEYNYNAAVTSTADKVFYATVGTVKSSDERISIVDRNATFGDIYPQTQQRSHTSFSIRSRSDKPVDLSKLQWSMNTQNVTVIDQQPFPRAVMERFEELYLAGEYLPQFVLGDVNGDRKANDEDLDLLAHYIEQPESTKISCLAAGDLTGDARITEQDLDAFSQLLAGKMWIDGTEIYIDEPLLYTQPSMPCDMQGLFFAASAAVTAGQTASIFFLDPSIDMHSIKVRVLSGSVDMLDNKLDYGLSLVTNTAMQIGEKIVLHITLPTLGSFLYALPIQAELTTLSLFTVDGDGDGDDPRDTPRPAIYGEEDEKDDCPVKDKGCEALLIDFFRYGAFYDLDMKTHKLVEPQLKSLGCNVTAIYPSYLRAPIFGNLFTGGGSQNTYINNSNIRTLDNINKAIDNHAKLLAKGRALGIQIVLGHGDKIGWGVSFSAPAGQAYSDNPTLSRTSLHQKIYDAEFSDQEFKVCGNIALDYSCESGYTAINIQTLNNTGSVSRTVASARDHTKHAGYDMNVGRGESLIGEDNGSVREGILSAQVKKLSAALEIEKKARENENHSPPRYKRLRNRLESYGKSYLKKHMFYLDGGFEDSDLEHSEKLR